MLVQHVIGKNKKVKVNVVELVDEVEGIMILVGITPTQEYLNALEKLPVKEIKELGKSYAEEFKALTGKHILTM